MNKRILAAVLIFIMALLYGCQLADPEAGPEAETAQDRLVGIFITTEYLDLIDMEAYLKDNLGDIADSSSLDITGIQSYSQRIYAVPVDNGYEFTDLEGILFASFWKETAGEGYWASTVGTGLSDAENKYLSTDTGFSIEHNATIYLPYDIGEICFYFNPVYQTKDGDVYLTAGSGMSTNTGLGVQMSETLSAEEHYTENGELYDYSFRATLTVSCIDVPEEVVLIQMDENHTVLHKNTYTSGQMPEEITPKEKTAYILIEEHYGGKILRSVNHPESEDIAVFYRLENDLCVKEQTSVKWSEDD